RADLLNAVAPPVLPVLQESENVQVRSEEGLGFAYLLPNVRSGPLSDVRVRQAICHGIDTKIVVDAKFHGLATPATGFLPSSHWAYLPTEGCSFDPARAMKLLDEAGYPDPDGPGGPLPRLTISYKTSTDRFRKSIALVFREQLKAIGIDVDVRSLEFGTLFSDIKKGNFELTSLKWSTVFEPDLMRQVFAVSAIPTAANNWNGFNRGGFQNPALDETLDRAMKANPEDRAALYGTAQQVISKELPYISLWHEKSLAVTSTRLQGFVPDPNGDLRPLEDCTEVVR
ncbi:MAG: ABC transporter substrate-binding protein, partial [Myxococcaceae bacterium]